MSVKTLKEDQGIRIDQGLVDRTNELLKDFTYHLDHDAEVDGELRVKMSKAELCLFKVASLMQEMVDERKQEKVDKFDHGAIIMDEMNEPISPELGSAVLQVLLSEPVTTQMPEDCKIVISVDERKK